VAQIGIHSMPWEEMFQHDLRGDCPCEPELVITEEETHQMAWVYQHNAVFSL
jgi:hypothetical protein